MIFLLLACTESLDTGKPAVADVDLDDDGYPADIDCDDADATLHPGAHEACDGIDNDCDLQVDEGVSATWYTDADGDTFGDAGSPQVACEAPAGAVADATDCDDANATRYPGAPERCDGLDNDCDDAVDEDAGEWGVLYRDADGDGFGDPAVQTASCTGDGTWTEDATDCDDARADVHPGAAEVCDALQVDEDCDGRADDDDDDAVGRQLQYPDVDADGFCEDMGGPDELRCRADPGMGFVLGDCDDADPAVSPDGLEVCGGADEDCDGLTDDADPDLDPSTTSRFVLDADGDGYGGVTVTHACAAPEGYVATLGDCDDADATVNPSAVEVCDDVDQDCDGAVDEGTGATTWYRDADGDGWGDSAGALETCTRPDGYAALPGDCDDADPTTNPTAVEVCGDLSDSNCDGVLSDTCVVTHCGVISADETWDAGYVHEVTCNVYVEGADAPTLTLTDGARVEMDSGTWIAVGGGAKGTLDVQGGDLGVTVTSALDDPKPGDWGAVYFGPYDRESVLTGLTIEYGGGATTAELFAFDNYNDYTLTLDRVTVRDSSSAGAWFNGGAVLSVTDCAFIDNVGVGMSNQGTFSAPFSGNRFEGTAAIAESHADDIRWFDDTNSFAEYEDFPLLVMGGTIENDATWADVGVPYTIEGTLFVEGSRGPVLRLGPGAELDFAAGTGIEVGRHAMGGLSVEGTEADPVRLEAAVDTAPWAGLLAWGPSVFVVDHADIGHAGWGGNGAVGVPIAFGADVTISSTTIHDSRGIGVYPQGGTLSMDDVNVLDGESYGVVIGWASSLVHLDGGLIDGNGDAPLRMYSTWAPALGPDATFGANFTDEIQLQGGTISTDATLRNYGIPYRVMGDTTVAGAADPTLTVEPGVEMLMNAGVDLVIGDYYAPGKLMADGDADSFLTILCGEFAPSPGCWGGIRFTWGSGGSSMKHARVEDAGGNGVAGIWLDYSGADGKIVSLADTTVTNSSHAGVYCGNCYVALGGAQIQSSETDGLRAAGYPGAVTDLTGAGILDNGSTALAMDAVSMTSLDLSTLTVSGNGVDGIEFAGSTWSGTSTLANVGLAYVVTDDLWLDAGERLTLEPGVEMAFQTGAGLIVSGGTLDAQGTATEPVLFTSAHAVQAAGDWDGVWVSGSAGTILRNVEVEYGGGSGYGAVTCVGADFTLEDSFIDASSTWGLYRGSGCSGSYSTVTYGSVVLGTMY